jgi:hypothetical protein
MSTPESSVIGADAEKVRSLGSAAFALLLFGGAIATGVWLGDRIAQWLANPELGIPDPIRAATGVASITFFVAMAERILRALLCVYEQLTQPRFFQVLEEAWKLLLLFVALGFPLAVAKEEVAKLVINYVTTPSVHPILVKTGTERPLAILPILFANAELDARYQSIPVAAAAIENQPDLFARGTRLTGKQTTDVQLFVAALVRCTDHATADEPVIVQVQGFASSREFYWLDPDKQERGKVLRDESVQLNRRVRRERGAALLAAIQQTEEFSRHLIRMRPPADFATQDEMLNRRVYVDRVDEIPIRDADVMTRRAEIRVLYAPGCAVAEIAGPPAT